MSDEVLGWYYSLHLTHYMLFCPEGLYQKGLLSCAIGQDILLFDHERVILVGLSIWLSDNLGSHIAIGHISLELSQIVSDEELARYYVMFYL